MTRRDGYVEWTDECGRVNVFVLDPIPFEVEDPRHPFEEEVRRYMDGRRVIERRGLCWCGCTVDHWRHAG